MGQILHRSETFMKKSVLPVSVSLGLSLSAHAGLFYIRGRLRRQTCTCAGSALKSLLLLLMIISTDRTPDRCDGSPHITSKR